MGGRVATGFPADRRRGIDHQREIAVAHDAPHLFGEFGQSDEDEIGRCQRGIGGDRTGQHADLETD
jgi:hypothetical protein